MTTRERVLDLCHVWADAERAGDVVTLDGLAADGFVLIGPIGFVLDKAAWLRRFGPDGLAISELGWREERVLEHGDGLAIVVGEQRQKARHAGGRADGSFRTAHTFTRASGTWKLALLHYSMLGGPPPFAPDR